METHHKHASRDHMIIECHQFGRVNIWPIKVQSKYQRTLKCQINVSRTRTKRLTLSQFSYKQKSCIFRVVLKYKMEQQGTPSSNFQLYEISTFISWTGLYENNIVKSTCGACVELLYSFYISRGFSLKRKRMHRTIADGIEFKRNRNNAMYIIELVCTNC